METPGSGQPAPGCGGDCGVGRPQAWAEKLGPDAPKGLDAGAARIVRTQTAAAVVAHAQEHGQGSVPAGLAVWAGGLLAPLKVDWRRRLRAIVRSAVAVAQGADDYTMTRLSRRSVALAAAIGRAPILPGLMSPKPRVTIVWDTSGSMSGGPEQHAAAEIVGITKAMGVPVMVLAVDAKVHAARKVFSAADLKAVALGGGGTDMTLGIAEAAKHRGDVIVVLTDGLTDWPAPNEMPRQRVIACVIGLMGVPEHLQRTLVRIVED